MSWLRQLLGYATSLAGGVLSGFSVWTLFELNSVASRGGSASPGLIFFGRFANPLFEVFNDPAAAPYSPAELADFYTKLLFSLLALGLLLFGAGVWLVFRAPDSRR